MCAESVELLSSKQALVSRKSPFPSRELDLTQAFSPDFPAADRREIAPRSCRDCAEIAPRLNIESNATQRGVCFGRAPQNPERLLISQIRSFREINSLLNLPGKLLSLDIQKLVKKHKNDQRIPRAQNV